MKWYNKLGEFLGVLFSIIYSFVLIIMIILFFASSLLKGDIYGDILKSIDISEIKLSDISPELVSMYGKDATIESILVDTLESAGIDSDVALEIVNDDKTKEVLGGFVGDIINYSVNKDEIPEIKTSDVEEILNNIDKDKLPNKEINKDEIKDVINNINSSTKDYLKEEFNYANRIN